jgi:hypothetical protein
MVYYDRPGATLYLVNDAGTQWLPGTPGSGGTLQNSQCSVNLATTSLVLASNTLTLNLATTFQDGVRRSEERLLVRRRQRGQQQRMADGGSLTAPYSSGG